MLEINTRSPHAPFRYTTGARPAPAERSARAGRQLFAELAQTLKQSARYLVKDLPLVAQRSRTLAAQKREPQMRQSLRQADLLRQTLTRASEVIPAYAAFKGRVPRHGVLDFLRSLPIVGTTFHNRAMPLVRNRLNDSARWRREACPCGSGYPTIELQAGKIEDRLFELDGRVVSPSVINFAFKGMTNMETSQVAQVAQVAREQWVLRVVAGACFSDDDAQALLANLRHRVSARLNVRVDRVDSISKLPSGKFKWVSQESSADQRA